MEQAHDENFPLAQGDEQAPNGQPEEQNNDEVLKKLRDEYTQTRAREIEKSVKLVEKDKRELLDLDKDTQNKVVKRLWGVNSIDELKLIHGDNFLDDDKRDSDNDDDDRIVRIERELKLTKYQQELKEIDREIELIKMRNPLAFESQEVEDKIKDEIKNISSQLPLEERVKRASAIVIGNSESLWKSLKTTGSYAPAKKEVPTSKSETSEASEEIKRIFGRK